MYLSVWLICIYHLSLVEYICFEVSCEDQLINDSFSSELVLSSKFRTYYKGHQGTNKDTDKGTEARRAH